MNSQDLDFHKLFAEALRNTLGEQMSLWAFRPELTLCVTIVAILLARIVAPRWKLGAFYLTVLGTCAALYFVIPWHWFSPDPGPVQGITAGQPIFIGMLVFDSFSIFMRGLLLLLLLLFAACTQVTAPVEQDETLEFFVLALGAVLGMCLMLAANHVLIVFLGIEMASVPSYVLAGFKRQERRASEAALKYAVFGAAAAGIMLYGLSLLVGVLGSAHLPTMSNRLAELLVGGLDAGRGTVLMLGGVMLAVGIAFKLSAFPFHFWAPDVFAGATAEVGAFLSTLSKASALGLLVRLGLQFAVSPDVPFSAATQPAGYFIASLIALIAAVTCTFGNLAAYGQTNMKRLLAYSSIAQAGYMLMPIAAAVAMAGRQPEIARFAVASLVVYTVIYAFTNFAAFIGVATLRNATGSEEIADYAGLIRTSPGLTVCMALIMFSLLGLPPLAGFSAKFLIFGALFDAAHSDPALLDGRLFLLLGIGGLNTVLSLFYYLRVVKVMVLGTESPYRAAPTIPLASIPGACCLVLTVPVVGLFFLLGGLVNWAQAAAWALLR